MTRPLGVRHDLRVNSVTMTAHACPSCGTTTTNHGRCATCAKPENTRKNQRPSRSVYNTPRWRELRLRVLIRDRFTCQDCGARANVGAHIQPFTSADDPLAWDERNIKASCADCNNSEAGKRAHTQPVLPSGSGTTQATTAMYVG